MMNRPRILDSQWSCHAHTFSPIALRIKLILYFSD